MHTNYQPARKGLTDASIAEAKRRAVFATMKNPDSKASVLSTLYGGRHANAEVLMLRIDPTDGLVAFQRSKLRYSDQGDFTRCYRGGF